MEIFFLARATIISILLISLSTLLFSRVTDGSDKGCATGGKISWNHGGRKKKGKKEKERDIVVLYYKQGMKGEPPRGQEQGYMVSLGPVLESVGIKTLSLHSNASPSPLVPLSLGMVSVGQVGCRESLVF